MTEKELPEMWVVKQPHEPFYMRIYNHFNNQKFHKKLQEKSLSEIHKLIISKKLVCDTCNAEIPLLLPPTYEQLSDIITIIINPIALTCCDDCMVKDFDNGNVIGAKEGFLDEITAIKKRQFNSKCSCLCHTGSFSKTFKENCKCCKRLDVKV